MRKAAVYCFDNQGKKLEINLNKLNMEGFVMEKLPQFFSSLAGRMSSATLDSNKIESGICLMRRELSTEERSVLQKPETQASFANFPF